MPDGSFIDPSVLSDLGAIAPVSKASQGATSFPSVSASQQLSADSDRLKILQDELSNATDPSDRAALQNSIATTSTRIASGNPFGTGTPPAKAVAAPAPHAATAGSFISPDVLNDLQKSVAPKSAIPVTAAATGSAAPIIDGLTGIRASVGNVEQALHIATGSAAPIIGGLAGIGASVGNVVKQGINAVTGTNLPMENPTDVVNNVTAASTYDPRTAYGKANVAEAADFGQSMGDQIEYASQGQNAIAQAIKTGIDNFGRSADAVGAVSPAAGAALKTLPAFVANAVPAARTLGSIGVAQDAISKVPRAEPSFGPKPTVPPGPDVNVPPPPTTPPAYVPTVADATPEMQAKITQAQAAGRVNSTALARHLEADTLPIPMSLSEGQATGDVDLISNEQNLRAKNGTAPFFNQQNADLISNASELRKQVAPQIPAADTMADHSQALIDMAKAADVPEVANISADYKALENAAGGQFPIDTQALVSNTYADLAKQLKTNYLQPSLKSTLDQFANGEPMNLEQYEALRSDAGETAANAPDGKERRAAGILRQNLDALPILPSAGEAGASSAAEIQQLANTARASAAARFAKLDADPAYAAAVSDPTPMGQSSALADKFAQKYIVNAPSQNVSTFLSNVQDPLAQQRVSAIGVDKLRDAAGLDLRTNTGNFSQSGYNGQLEKFQQSNKLGAMFPDAKTNQQIQSLGNVARYTQQQPRGAYVNNSNTFVSSLAPHVGNAARMGANALAGGLPVGDAAAYLVGRAALNRGAKTSTAVGAGLGTLGSIGK